jgi:hypothetical protein
MNLQRLVWLPLAGIAVLACSSTSSPANPADASVVDASATAPDGPMAIDAAPGFALPLLRIGCVVPRRSGRCG